MKKLLIAFLLLASMASAQTLTVPAISVDKQVLVSANNLGIVSVANTTWTQATFTESIDAFGEFSVATFTSAIAQTVEVYAECMFAAGANGKGLFLSVNGATPDITSYVENLVRDDNTGLPSTMSIYRVVSLTAGQTISAFMYQASGGALDNYQRTIIIKRIK